MENAMLRTRTPIICRKRDPNRISNRSTCWSRSSRGWSCSVSPEGEKWESCTLGEKGSEEEEEEEKEEEDIIESEGGGWEAWVIGESVPPNEGFRGWFREGPSISLKSRRSTNCFLCVGMAPFFGPARSSFFLRGSDPIPFASSFSCSAGSIRVRKSLAVFKVCERNRMNGPFAEREGTVMDS